MLKKFERFQHLAELYHVYRSIQRYAVRTFFTLSTSLMHIQTRQTWEEALKLQASHLIGCQIETAEPWK